jgi:hypothetical protein
MKVGRFIIDVREIDLPVKHSVVTLQHETLSSYQPPITIEPIEADLLARCLLLHAQSLRVHGDA